MNACNFSNRSLTFQMIGEGTIMFFFCRGNGVYLNELSCLIGPSSFLKFYFSRKWRKLSTSLLMSLRDKLIMIFMSWQTLLKNWLLLLLSLSSLFQLLNYSFSNSTVIVFDGSLFTCKESIKCRRIFFLRGRSSILTWEAVVWRQFFFCSFSDGWAHLSCLVSDWPPTKILTLKTKTSRRNI